MSPARQADPELDNLIYEITVDSRDEDEQLTGFEASFDEDASFPCPGTVVGEEVQILSVSRAENRRELTATLATSRTPIRHRAARHRHPRRPTTARLLAAYRRWPGV